MCAAGWLAAPLLSFLAQPQASSELLLGWIQAAFFYAVLLLTYAWCARRIPALIAYLYDAERARGRLFRLRFCCAGRGDHAGRAMLLRAALVRRWRASVGVTGRLERLGYSMLSPQLFSGRWGSVYRRRLHRPCPAESRRDLEKSVRARITSLIIISKRTRRCPLDGGARVSRQTLQQTQTEGVVVAFAGRNVPL